MRWFAVRRLIVGLAFGIIAASAGILPAAAEPPHHEIVLTLDPAAGAIKVRDRIRIAGRNEIAFRLANWMQMTGIQVDGQPASGRLWDGGVSVTVPSLGSHRIDIIAEGIVPRPAGAKAEAAPAALVSADGIYLPGWVEWFPQIGNERLSFSLTIETPPDIRAAATGRFESETLTTTRNRVLFSSTDSPSPPSIFAGPYTVDESFIERVRIRTYFHRTLEPLAQDYIERAARYIRSFEEQIGPFPFPDFNIVSAPLPVGLGFAGLTYIDRRILPLPFIKARSLAHEVLHNWWGNGVFTDPASGNWAEGLTTYMADHELTASQDPKQAAEMRLGWLRDYAALPSERDVPAVRFQSKTHDAAQVIGYGKVALIFHMLRFQIGDTAFKDGLRQFWNTHKLKTARWADVRRAFEASAGTDLIWFFEQWTERAGAPQIELLDAALVGKESETEVVFTLRQSTPIYRIKVPVEISTEAGASRFHIWLNEPTTTTRIKLNAAPSSIQIDPEHSLFRRLLPGEAPPIFRDVLLEGQARTVLLYDEPNLLELSRQLVERLFEGSTPPIYSGTDPAPQTALLAIGPAQRIEDLMKHLDIPGRPSNVAEKGSTRAWMASLAAGQPVLFIEAERPEELQALTRSLPHYRSKSYVALEEGRVVTSGVLPPTGSPLVRQLP